MIALCFQSRIRWSKFFSRHLCSKEPTSTTILDSNANPPSAAASYRLRRHHSAVLLSVNTENKPTASALAKMKPKSHTATNIQNHPNHQDLSWTKLSISKIKIRSSAHKGGVESLCKPCFEYRNRFMHRSVQPCAVSTSICLCQLVILLKDSNLDTRRRTNRQLAEEDAFDRCRGVCSYDVLKSCMFKQRISDSWSEILSCCRCRSVWSSEFAVYGLDSVFVFIFN